MAPSDDMENFVELKIREYFDHFLKEILPEILNQREKTCVYGQELHRLKYICTGIAIGLAVCIPQIFDLLNKFF